MTAYVIVQGQVSDPEQYERYKAQAPATITAAGGRYLVRGADVTVLEGDPPPERTVVLQFPNRQAALDWYHGDGYTAARALRKDAARLSIYVVDGLE